MENLKALLGVRFRLRSAIIAAPVIGPAAHLFKLFGIAFFPEEEVAVA